MAQPGSTYRGPGGCSGKTNPTESDHHHPTACGPGDTPRRGPDHRHLPDDLNHPRQQLHRVVIGRAPHQQQHRLPSRNRLPNGSSPCFSRRAHLHPAHPHPAVGYLPGQLSPRPDAFTTRARYCGHIALGAQFTLVGRVYLYGLMAGGRDSVDRTIQMLSEQVGRTMRLLGVATVDELTPTHVTQLAPRAPPPPAASAPTLGGDLSWH